jgi:hypothetical protein
MKIMFARNTRRYAMGRRFFSLLVLAGIAGNATAEVTATLASPDHVVLPGETVVIVATLQDKESKVNLSGHKAEPALHLPPQLAVVGPWRKSTKIEAETDYRRVWLRTVRVAKDVTGEMPLRVDIQHGDERLEARMVFRAATLTGNVKEDWQTLEYAVKRVAQPGAYDAHLLASKREGTEFFDRHFSESRGRRIFPMLPGRSGPVHGVESGSVQRSILHRLPSVGRGSPDAQ